MISGFLMGIGLSAGFWVIGIPCILLLRAMAKESPESREYAQKSLQALYDRNKASEQQLALLDQLDDTLRRIAASMEYRSSN